MAKIKLLVLAAVLVLLMAGGAQAAEVTARGYWWMEAISRTNWNFNAAQQDNFAVEQKLRTAFTFTANENLRGVLDTQIGTNNWGNGLYQVGAGRSPSTAAGSSYSAGSGNIMLRQGFIEYKWPNTLVNTKVGFQVLSLPAAFGGGSAIFDDIAAAAVVSAPINENFGILAGYSRPADSNTYGATAAISGTGTATDVVFAAVPITFPGISVTPFGMFAYSGHQSGGTNANLSATVLSGLVGPNTSTSEGVRGYWGGAAMVLTSPAGLPIKVMADFNYGKATYSNYYNNTKDGGRAGWLADIAVDYTSMSWMTPSAYLVYSSGESGKNTDRSGRMPVLGVPQNWTLGTGSTFFGERLELTGSTNVPAGYTLFTMGYWAAGLNLKNISLVDKLSHDVNILFAKGTNSSDYLKNTVNLRGVRYAGFLTEHDSLWEVDLNSRYKIYDELTAYLYLGFINSHFDTAAWSAAGVANSGNIGNSGGSGNAYKIGVGLNYFF